MPDKLSMISLLVCMALIFFGAVFFWFRYLYIHSFSTAERRDHFIKRLWDMVLFVPIGLQAAFLFCFALYYLSVIGKRLASLFDKVVLGQKTSQYPDFYPLQIIFIGSMMVAVSYILQRWAAAFSDKVSAWLMQALVFAGNIFLLRTLVQNIYESIGWNGSLHPAIIYGNSYGWILALFFSLVFLIPVEGQIKPEGNTKYLALVARLLWLYCFIAFLFALPRIIYFLSELL